MKKYEHPIYEGYFATEDGKIFNNEGVLLKGTQATVGYWQHYIKGKTLLTHRLVYECVNNCVLKSSDIINHLDHNKINNNINNLEKTDVKGNVHHYYNEIGKNLIVDTELEVGDRSEYQTRKNSRLTKPQMIELIYLSLDGVENKILAEKFGLHERYVSLVRHKKRWKKLWVELGLESSETTPSGGRPASAVEAGCPIKING